MDGISIHCSGNNANDTTKTQKTVINNGITADSADAKGSVGIANVNGYGEYMNNFRIYGFEFKGLRY